MTNIYKNWLINFETCPRPMSVRYFIFALCKHCYTVIFLLVIFNLCMAIALSVRPYIIKQILNSAPLYNEFSSLSTYVPVFVYLFIAFANVSIMRLNDYMYNIRLLPKLNHIVASETINIVLSSPSYSTYQKSETLAESIADMINFIPEIINVSINKFAYLIFSVTIGIIVLSSVNLIFSIVLILWIVFVSLTFYLLFPKISILSQDTASLFANLKHNIFDILTNIISVKLHNTVQREHQYLSTLASKFISSQKKSSKRHFLMWATYGYSFVCMLCINFFFLIQSKQLDIISIGDFALVITVNVIIFDIFWTIFRDSLSFFHATSKVRLALQQIVQYTTKYCTTDNRELLSTKNENIIEFENVYLTIQGKIILENINTSILPGQKIAIVGNSGSGKSSFVNLLINLLNPNSGTIKIGGANVSELSPHFFSEQVCFISPHTILFDRSIYENIAYSCYKTDKDRVFNATKLALAHDFILSMPEGYDTILSKKSMKLSTGQIQRVLLARAILKNPNITILDEATSHIDQETEVKIFENLLSISRNKTIIIITHRLTSINNFVDRIISFENGQIINEDLSKTFVPFGY